MRKFRLCDCTGVDNYFGPGQCSDLEPKILHILGPPICFSCGGLGRVPKEEDPNFNASLARITQFKKGLHPLYDPNHKQIAFGATSVGLCLHYVRGIELEVKALKAHYGAERDSLAEKVCNGLLDEPKRRLAQQRRHRIQEMKERVKTRDIALAAIYMYYCRSEKVIVQLNRLLNTYTLPDLIQVHIAIGDFYFHYCRDYREAKVHYRRAVDLGNTTPDQLYTLGICCLGTKLQSEPAEYNNIEEEAVHYLELAMEYGHEDAHELLRLILEERSEPSEQSQKETRLAEAAEELEELSQVKIYKM